MITFLEENITRHLVNSFAIIYGTLTSFGFNQSCQLKIKIVRDKRFIAEHHGGTLTKENHHHLMRWSCQCAEHILPLFSNKIDSRLTSAINTAKNWTTGKASVGDARNASFECIELAKELNDPKEVAVARSVGHTVATAHMADHSLRAAAYALKAISLANLSGEEERKWQDEQLSPGILDLILSARIREIIPSLFIK